MGPGFPHGSCPRARGPRSAGRYRIDSKFRNFSPEYTWKATDPTASPSGPEINASLARYACQAGSESFGQIETRSQKIAVAMPLSCNHENVETFLACICLR